MQQEIELTMKIAHADDANETRTRRVSTTNSTSNKENATSDGWSIITILCWKNYLLKLRHPAQLLIEICFPLIFIIIFSGLKHLTDDVLVQPGWSSSNLGISQQLFTSEYYMKELSMHQLFHIMNTESIRESEKILKLDPITRTRCRDAVTKFGQISLNTSSPTSIQDACGDAVVPYKLAIIPDDTFTRDYFYATISQWYPSIAFDNGNPKEKLVLPSLEDLIVFHKNEKQFENYVTSSEYGKDMNHPKIYAGIVFLNHPDPGKFGSIEYSLRLNATGSRRGGYGDVPETNGELPFYNRARRSIHTAPLASYATSGFSTLQTLVSRFINCLPDWDGTKTKGICQYNISESDQNSLKDMINKTLRSDSYIKNLNMTALSPGRENDLLKPYTLVPQPVFGNNVFAMPTDAYTHSEFYGSVKIVFGIAFVVSYLYSVSRVTALLILEKELKMREIMKILGIRERYIIIAWYLVYMVIIIVVALLQTLISRLGLFPNSDFFLIFVFFALFGTNALAYSFCLSSFFSKAKLGSYISLMLFAMMYIITFGFGAETAAGVKAGLSIFPPVALSMAVNCLASVEETSLGMGWDNIGDEYGNYKFSTALGFMVLNFFLYTVIGLYIEQTIPKDYGVARPWYFPLLWFKKKQFGEINDFDKVQDAASQETKNIEPVSEELLAQDKRGESCVIHNLRKVFKSKGKEKVAVKNLNLSMYRDQITCLLGHNGAGKTTTISMLTGMIPVTSGTALIGGKSILKNMNDIRRSLGICPQHDVLYLELTVYEHLYFFGRIKGFKGKELEDLVESHIKEVGLTDKRNRAAGSLSGGMKRKLSVAIAYIGHNKFVLLDEPTSGMDPYSRRATWELLLKNRAGRVTLLTTHFMDEADLLADRTAIMASGKLQCCGTSMFLKKIYGVGYQLTCTKKSQSPVEGLLNFIGSYVPEVGIVSNAGVEVSFQLPLHSCSQFPSMFDEMDSRLTEFGLDTYGVSVTTLEEVFLKAANPINESDETPVKKQNNDGADLPSANISPKNQKPDVLGIRAREIDRPFITHIRALFYKRMLCGYRDKKALFLSIVLPIILLIVGFKALMGVGSFKNSPKLALSVSSLPKDQQTLSYCTGNSCSSLLGLYTESKINSIDSNTFGAPPYIFNSANVFGVPYTFSDSNMEEKYSLRLGEMCYNYGYGHAGIPMHKRLFGGYIINATDDIIGYNIASNTSVTHGLAMYKNYMDEAIYRRMGRKYKGASEEDAMKTTILLYNHPLPHSATTAAFFDSVKSFSAVTTIMLAFAFFPGAVIFFIVKEKNSLQNSKFQQYVSGVSPVVYWLSNYLFDLAVYAITFAAVLILIPAFDFNTFTGVGTCTMCAENPFGAIVLVLVLYGLATIPFIYIISTFFSEASTAQNMAIMIYFLLGMILAIVSMALDLIESTTEINKKLKFIWRLSPIYCVGSGLFSLSTKDIFASLGTKTKPYSAFDMDVYGWELVYLSLEVIIFPFILIIFDIYGPEQVLFFITQWFQESVFKKSKKIDDCKPAGGSTDIDVLEEEKRVLHSESLTDIIVLKRLRKLYPGAERASVEGLSFGLAQGECFGFLGTNGAGKTTTMSMLTGNVIPSSGKAKLSNYDIVSQQLQIRRLIGYCPQFDALIDLMTVREHLEMFGMLKGVEKSQLNTAVIALMTRMGLIEFENKLTQSLSGGNKRKLCVAIAIIGAPPIIFLDEPSTGMDPISRRFMWEILADISTRNKQSTLVLTTHSMEECEALCSRVGIMVNGVLRCLGSIQHLKTVFGDGLLLEARFVSPTRDNILTFINERLHNSRYENSKVLCKQDIQEICACLNDATRNDLISPTNPSGWAIDHALETNGSIELSLFISWWIMQDRIKYFDDYIHSCFSSCEMVELHNEKVRYKIYMGGKNRFEQNDPSRVSRSNATVSLSRIFKLIETTKEQYCIQEYSISQTTLEQIFNQFAKEQINPDHDRAVVDVSPSAERTKTMATPVVPIIASPNSSEPQGVYVREST